jgi:hypothetical protein
MIRSAGHRLAVLALAALAACGSPHDDATPDADWQLERGRSLARAVADLARGPATPEVAIAAGYLERLRLGLGSPFRLMEHTLQDPRLEQHDRERLAWSLLARTADGYGYRADPGALGDRNPDRAERHLRRIEGAIRGAADPDVGMLAIRLAYTMAAAEGTITGAYRDRAIAMAALIRDRVVSRRDARRLLRAAGDHTDPLSLLTVWRVNREFEVERPGTLAPSVEVEREAIALAPRLLVGIREAEVGPRSGPRVANGRGEPRPVLGAEAARRLALISARYDAPPQTPVLLPVRRYWRLADADGRAGRFFENAVNEERLAAEYALLQHGDSVGLAPRLAVLGAAVGLRAYAQERPWFPGFEGPTRRDLEDRFGLESVTFADEVPPDWRPYYRRMLETSFADLQRVLPSLVLRGLRVRIATRATSIHTLAVHDPGDRTVYIPARTGAGTIAHEIAHDIDWQVALRRYNVRGDYGTDRAVRVSDARLAPMLAGLAAATLTEPYADEHGSRPAEVFARNMDWLVAVALAREGRLNGYLSSVQDDVLRGYGTVPPPDVSGEAGESLVAILDQVAPLHAATRRWYLGSYGRVRAPTAWDLARRVVEAPLGTPESEPAPAGMRSTLERLERLEAVRDSALTLTDGWCHAAGYDQGATEARRQLVRLAVEARARGVALQGARQLAGPDGRRWVEAVLDGRSWDPEPSRPVVEVLDELVSRVRSLGTTMGSRTLDRRPVMAACELYPFVTE